MSFDIIQGHEIVIPYDRKKPGDALTELVRITKDIPKTIFKHAGYSSKDKWLSFVFAEGKTKKTEKDVFSLVGDDAKLGAVATKFIEQLIAYNKKHGTAYVHEELETGSDAIAALVRHSIDHVPLYVRFLKSIDLEHTVAQPETVDEVIQKYGRARLKTLITYLRKADEGIDLFSHLLDEPQKDSPRARGLCDAVRDANLDEMRQLIAAGADVNRSDGNVPLHCVYTSVDAVALLHQAGADLNARGAHGATLLHQKASAVDGLPLVTYLVEHGADVHGRDEHGQTPLHQAYNEANIRCLCAHGADVNATDDDGRTPLTTIVRVGGFKLAARIKALVELGADVSRVDKDGNSVLHHAVRGHDLEGVKALVAAGANPDLANHKGQTPRDESGWMFRHLDRPT